MANIIKAVNEKGALILLTGQNASPPLSMAERGYVLEVGGKSFSGGARELLADDHIEKAYLVA